MTTRVQIRKACLYLDRLRRSNRTNMFGALPYMDRECSSGLSSEGHREVWNHWVEVYDPEIGIEAVTDTVCERMKVTE